MMAVPYANTMNNGVRIKKMFVLNVKNEAKIHNPTVTTMLLFEI